MRTASPNKAITFDDTDFPLLEVSFGDGHADRDWEWMLHGYEERYAQRKRYALLVNAGSLSHTPSASARKLITDWQILHMENTARWCIGTSVYMSSGMIRGALTAMNWFVKQPGPMNYPASMAEGLDWCVERLDACSLLVPSTIRKRQVAMLSESSLGRPLGVGSARNNG
jgi:hypothetical protein